jgi:hypothetical protein
MYKLKLFVVNVTYNYGLDGQQFKIVDKKEQKTNKTNH